jgi:hypothetical protein
VKAIFDATERMSVTEFLRHKYGTDECPTGMENIWRLALTRHMHESFLFFCSNFAYLSDKKDKLVTLKPFAGQAIHTLAIESQRKAGLPVRICELKARQVGFTLINIARGLHYCLDENRRALILVDDEDVAAEQATRLATMLNGLPGWLQPMRRIQNLKHLVFDNPNPKDRLANPGLNAAMQITVPSSFRGAPPGFVCVSEYAHMDADRQMAVQAGIISAMALSPEKMLIIDTTPNGNDDSYEPMVRKAIEMSPKWTRRIENWKGEISAEEILGGVLGIPEAVERGRPGMVPSMCPWRIHEEFSCKSPATPRGELPKLKAALREETVLSLGKLSKYGGEEEKDLAERYGVSIDRLFWRRCKIDSYDVPTEEMALLMFRQEHLSTVDSAFIDSGTAPFDRGTMDAMARQEREPIHVGLFDGEDRFDHRHPERLQWQEIRLYAPPQNGEKYTMGVDTNIAYESPDSDASVAQVVRHRDNKIVATYEARVPANILLEQLYYLYRWYFNCYYAIETAGMGYQLVRWAIDKGMSNCHYYKRYDADYPEPTKFPGWETKSNTRPMMDQTFTALFCNRSRESGKVEPLLNIPDAKTQREIRGLTRTPTGSFKSSRGHDDHYDALCIALVIGQDPYSGLVRQKEKDEEEKRVEFERAFYAINNTQLSRNRPDLANI